MLASKRTTLKPLLESANGIHLTAYLSNNGDLIDLKSQLRETINQSYEWLNPVMTTEERNKFLEPLEALLLDARIFKQMKGNIGLFRNQDSFRVLNIPIDVKQSCQVATSFHIKPLLRWLQSDQEFLLLGLSQESAHLYIGSQDSLKLIDSILFPDFFKENKSIDGNFSLKEARKRKSKEAQTFSWLNEWILDLTKVSGPKLYVAGEKFLVDNLHGHLRYKNVAKATVANYFSATNAGEVCQTVRKIVKNESRRLLEKSLMEFRFAEQGNRAKKNIFQIAKAVVQGKVRKLVVTDEFSIFGKIDPKTGGLAIHLFDLDHEDDCILDDLAQMVLSQGGEVVVASRDQIPKGRPILAILDDDETPEEKIDISESKPFQERLA